MNAKSPRSKTPWVDPDDAPEITDEWVQGADVFEGAKLVKRGRPVGSTQAVTKVRVSMRLAPDALASWRASGPGWQTRAAELLAKHAP